MSIERENDETFGSIASRLLYRKVGVQSKSLKLREDRIIPINMAPPCLNYTNVGIITAVTFAVVMLIDTLSSTIRRRLLGPTTRDIFSVNLPSCWTG